MQTQPAHREQVPEAPNRLGIEGIEFIEYATTRPQALGDVLEKMGFCAVARHRSREITLYRQGGMNLIVNAHPDDARISAMPDGQPVIVAVALRVRDARAAHAKSVELGAWSVPSHAQAMELHIPAVRGPGGSRFYFVDRWKEFSIYDIDFQPIAGVPQHPPALGGMGYFGVVQYVGPDRGADWEAYYQHLFDFQPLESEARYGILPKGRLLRSPCCHFLWQLVEPDWWMEDRAPEQLQRIGLGVADVPATVQLLQQRGVVFVDEAHLHPEDKGALTRSVLGGVAFELVQQPAVQEGA